MRLVWPGLLLALLPPGLALAHQEIPRGGPLLRPPASSSSPPPRPPPPPSSAPPLPSLPPRPLEIAVPPPPGPPPVQPRPLIPWTLAEGDRLRWIPTASAGPSVFVGRDFTGFGFNIGVGVHHLDDFDPNAPEVSGAARVATLGLLGLPRGLLWGNERGIELTSRLVWIGHDEMLGETAVRPVSRVLRADGRSSTPSVIGLLAPAVGFTTLVSKDDQPHAGLTGRYGGLLLRWSFGLRRALVEAPMWVFAELEPTAQIIVPADGSRAHASFGLNLNAGFLPLLN